MTIPKICTACLAPKPPTTDFFRADRRNGCGLVARCRACERRLAAEWRLDPEVKAREAAYRRRPEVAERRRDLGAAYRRTDRGKAAAASYQASARRRVGMARDKARRLMKRATDPAVAARQARRIALCDAELARMDRAMSGDKKRGRPRGSKDRGPRRRSA